MIRRSLLGATVGCLLLAVCPPSVRAQAVECPRWVTPPGGSNPEDRAPHRCNLQVQPDLAGHVAALPAPRFRPFGAVHATVFVLEDGSVDPEFTRLLTRSGDRDFADRLLEALTGIRLTDGERGGLSTRFGFELVVETGTRSDSIPEEIRWEYRKGTLRDSLLGRWVPAPPEPAYSSAARAAVLGRVAAQLIAMRVVTPERGLDYCVLGPEGDSASAQTVRQRIAQLGHWRLAQDEGCERDVERRRLIFSDPVRTGQGRTVVTVSGDHLESWPPGFDGRFYPSWTAYCALLDQGSDFVDCWITPVYTGIPVLDSFARPDPIRQGEASSGPAQVRLLVHGAGLFLTDTIAGEATEVPRLEDLPLYDPGLRRCVNAGPAGAAARWEPSGQRLVRIELAPMGAHRDVEADLVRVYRRRPGPSEVSVACAGTADRPYAVTALDGLGPPLEGPVDLCLDFSCARYLELPVHEPLSPVLRLPFADLRPGARDTWGFLMFKLDIDRPMEGLIPILVLGVGEEVLVTTLTAFDDGSYRMSINRTPPFPADSEIRLYLIRR